MNVKYINPFITATQNVFQEFVGISLTPGKPSIYIPQEDANKFDVSGIIGLAGEVVGVVVISLPKIPALKVTSKLVGKEVKIFDDFVTDAVGEIVNIIAGNVKKDMEEFKIVISLPSIVKGNGHTLSWISGVPVIKIPFASEYGDFFVFVSLKDILGI